MKKLSVVLRSVVGLSLPIVVNAGSGDLDPSYGTGGFSAVEIGTTGNAGGRIALRPGGGSVQVGSARNNYSLGSYGYDVGVVCYNADGSLDTSFSEDGMLMTDINSSGNVYTDDRGGKVLVQPDGKILVAGTTRQYTKSGSAGFEWYMWDLLLLRYLPNGDLDPNFASAGKMVQDLSGTAEGFNDIELQSDGKIIGAGYTMSGLNNRYLVTRFNTDGTPDTTFASGGKLIYHFSECTLEDAYDVLVMPDDTLLLTGRGIKSDGNHVITLLKLTADGQLDSSFGSGGKLIKTVDGISDGSGATLDNEGRILVIGNSAPQVNSEQSVVLMRLLTDGTVDTTFATDGISNFRISTEFKRQSFRPVVVHADGKITAVGTGTKADWSGYSVVVAQWNDDGFLNTDFGVDGWRSFNVDGSSRVSVSKCVLLPDNNLLVGAHLEKSDKGRFATLKILSRSPWNSTVIAQTGGWMKLSWFGMYKPMDDGWIYQESYGFMEIMPESTPDNVILYGAENHWQWTCDLIYPWTYDYATGSWVNP